VVDIYQKTEKESGLRKRFIEQVTVSVDVEDFEEFVDYWPAEAWVELAMFCHSRHVPPVTLEDMSKSHQPSFYAHSASEYGQFCHNLLSGSETRTLSISIPRFAL
jgi:hypothetical protein